VQALDAAEKRRGYIPRRRNLPEDLGTTNVATSLGLLKDEAALPTPMVLPREAARTSRRNGARASNEGRVRRRRGGRATAAAAASQVATLASQVVATPAQTEELQTQQLSVTRQKKVILESSQVNDKPITTRMQKVILDSSQVNDKPGCCLIRSASLDGLWMSFEERCRPQPDRAITNSSIY